MIEAELRSGNLDVERLCLALSDWSSELRILNEKGRRGETPAAHTDGFDCIQTLIE